MFFECIRIDWFDIYNLNKGENEAEAFEAFGNGDRKAILDRGKTPRFSYAELIKLSRDFRL